MHCGEHILKRTYTFKYGMCLSVGSQRNASAADSSLTQRARCLPLALVSPTNIYYDDRSLVQLVVALIQHQFALEGINSRYDEPSLVATIRLDKRGTVFESV